MAVDLFTRFLQESAGAVQDFRDAYTGFINDPLKYAAPDPRRQRTMMRPARENTEQAARNIINSRMARRPWIALHRHGNERLARNMSAAFDRVSPLAQDAARMAPIIGPFMSWLQSSSEGGSGGSSEPGSAAEAQAQAQPAASSPTPPPGMTAAQFDLARMVNAVQGNTRALGPQADAAFTSHNQREARQPQQQYPPVVDLLARMSGRQPQEINAALNEAAAVQAQAPPQGGGVHPIARLLGPIIGIEPQAADDLLRGMTGQPRRDSGAATNAPEPVGGTPPTGGVAPNAAMNDQSWSMYLNSLSNQQLNDMYRNPEAAASLLLEMSNIPRNSGLGDEFVRRAVLNQTSFEQRNADPLEFAQYLWNDLQYLRSTGEQGIQYARNMRRQNITQLRDEFLNPESPNALHLRELEMSISDPDRAEHAIWSTFIAPYYGSDVTNSAASAASAQFARMWEEYNAAVIAGRYNKGEFGKYLVDNGFLLFRELEGER